MIVQVTKPGDGFKGKVLYLMYGHLDNLNPDRVAWIETRNLPTDDPLAAARIMAATARDRRTKQKPVYHFSISFDYDDPADRALMLRVADRLLLDLKMQGYQALMVAHRDRAHAHLHVVINRIHPEDLTVWSNWKDYWRIERSLRAQEAELGLRVVPGFHVPVFDDNGNRLRPAQLMRGDADFLERVSAEAGPHLASARSWAELERALAAHGLRVRMKGRGMVVTDGKHEVKASDIDWPPGQARIPGDRRTFSRSRMEARLGIHGEYRRRQQLADRTLDERVALVEEAVVAAPSTESSTPAERTSEVTQVATSEPDHGPVSASLSQPTRQGEDDTRDPVVQTVATGRRDDGMPVSWAEVLPVTPAPAPIPNPAPRQPEQLALPLSLLPEQEGKPTPPREAPRFTLYDDGTVFGVRDRDGQVFFAETRERALAEVKRANAIAAVYPDVISMGHLREMDGAWRDARGLPHLPEPQGRRVTVPAPDGLSDELPPLPPPVARVQRESPTAPAAALRDDRPARSPERASPPARPTEPGAPPSIPVDSPAPIQSPVRTNEPRTPAPPPARTVERPPVPRDHPPTRSPERIPEPPVRARTHPFSDRERYRIVLRAFKDELAALYRDPRAARRAFNASLTGSGSDATARVLKEKPEQFGRLRFGADLRRLPEAGRWATSYAEWQTERTRLEAGHVAATFRRAVAVEEAEAVLREAGSAYADAAASPSFLAHREQSAKEGERVLERRLSEIYDRPASAREQIEAYRDAHGGEAFLHALENTPERFGPLRTEWKRRFGMPLIRDKTTARREARSWSPYLDGAFASIADRPTRGEYAQAKQAIRAARSKVDVAQGVRDALGPATALDSVREAVVWLDVAGRGSADRAGRLDRQVRSMLPPEALPVVRSLIQKIVQQQERERGREQQRNFRRDVT